MDTSGRKQYFIDYYAETDYDQVMKKLPDVIKDAEKRAGEVVEPTISEKKEVMAIIKDFIRKKKRKVYGGTALNETIKIINPRDAIYDEHCFSDIEFYSPVPVLDLVELTNILYEKKYKYVRGIAAQHEGTYSVRVNFNLYCDISFVPARVFNAIKTIQIDGIDYVHPHFMYIDYLRMFNDPLNAAGQRWEKAFKRTFVLLKNYPLDYFDKPIKMPRLPKEHTELIRKIKNEFMVDTSNKDIQDSSLISGFEAYNFFVKHAADDRNAEQPARLTSDLTDIANMIVEVPYFDLVSVNYINCIEKVYKFLKETASDPSKLSIEEYYPILDITKHLMIITYNDNPLVRIWEADGACIPNIKTTRGYMYVTYQYLMMQMFINKFRSYMDKNQEMYFNYGIAISNLVIMRNTFLSKYNLPVINKSIFGEFRISCVGVTMSYIRTALLRGIERAKRGKSFTFSYDPEKFLTKSEEEKANFDPIKYKFPNISGNKIANPRALTLTLDSDGNLVRNVVSEEESETTEEK